MKLILPPLSNSNAIATTKDSIGLDMPLKRELKDYTNSKMANQESIEDFKKKVLGVLKYCIAFFEKHQINWFLACGSAIGAVRHKGFIPWDDDIDIYMPRSDYNKLYDLNDELVKDGYCFLSIDTPGYPLAFGKISDCNTTLWSERKFPINFGVYIDIFPLDLTSKGMMSFGISWMKYRKLLYKLRIKQSKITFGGFLDDIKNKRFDSIQTLAAKISLCFIRTNELIADIHEIENKWNNEDGDRYVSVTEAGMYMFPRIWFEEFIPQSFEDITVRISEYYDDYLTYIYGDYMTPPPPEKRLPGGPHGKFYVNLNERIPINKVKKTIK